MVGSTQVHMKNINLGAHVPQRSQQSWLWYVTLASCHTHLVGSWQLPSLFFGSLHFDCVKSTDARLTLIKAGCDMAMYAYDNHFVRDKFLQRRQHGGGRRSAVKSHSPTRQKWLWYDSNKHVIAIFTNGPLTCSQVVSRMSVEKVSANQPHQSGCDMKRHRHFTAALTG